MEGVTALITSTGRRTVWLLLGFQMEENDKVNVLALLPFIVLIAPIVPAFIEIFRRKDKGPREIPEQTLNEEQADISKNIPMFERARARARVKIVGESIRIVGDVSVPSGVEINENMIVHGNLRLGSKCHVHGSVKSFGEVEIGEYSVIEGHIISDGMVTVGRNAKVKGIIDSAGDIILKEHSEVQAVSSEKSVGLAQGVKIDRRIPAGESITEPLLPPSTREKEMQPERPAEATIPSVSTFFEDRRYQPTSDDKARIFQSLRNEIRRVDKPEEKKMDEVTLKKPSQRDTEILKLAVSGHDIDEIGLRLLMDPVHVQKTIDSLIEAGYLDEHLKPLRPQGVEEDASVTTPAKEEKEKPEVAESRVEEVFEGLLASKLRPEVKGEPKVEEKREISTRTEMREFLKEWQRESSVLFGYRETGKKRPSSVTRKPEQTEEEDRKLPDSVDADSQEIALGDRSRWTHEKHLGSALPLLTLVAIVLSEVAYYNPGLLIFTFLKSVMPPAVEVWMFFLGVSLALAVITVLFFARMLSSPRLKTG